MKLSSILFFCLCSVLSGCTSAEIQRHSKQPEKNSFFGLIDYDGTHSDGIFDGKKYVRNGKKWIFTADDFASADGDFQSKIDAVSSGDTVVLDGSRGIFFLKTTRIRKGGITIQGKNNAVLDFSKTYTYSAEEINAAVEKVRKQAAAGGAHTLGSYDAEMEKNLSQGRGLYIMSEYNVIEDIVVRNASDNGILIGQGGNYNIIRRVEAYSCGDSGFQVSGTSSEPVDCSNDYKANGPHDNFFFDCYSHENFDPWNLGENADGFAVKGGAGDRNYFENCTAEYNSDDGWDCYRIRGSCTLVHCTANFNGINPRTNQAWESFSNGNGFKMGGGDRTGNEPQTHRHAQYLKGCSATGNAGNSGKGFDRNNQFGSLYLVDCFSTNNKANLLFGNSTQYKKIDYEFGTYGNVNYVLNCHIGSEHDVVNGNYEGEKITVK